MAATPKTYIPWILWMSNKLKKFFNEHSTTLKKYMGNGLFAALTLAVEIVVIIASIVEGNAPTGDEPWSDFNAVNTLSSQQINQFQGAWDKFQATIAVEV
jgi:hypothetical protein